MFFNEKEFLRTGIFLSKKIIETVSDLVKDEIEQLGYELVDVEYKKETEGMVLIVFIYHEDGITLEDCEKVSRAIDPILDEHDPISESYYLSVSSPGLNRSLKTDADLRRHLGKEIDIKLFKATNKKKLFSGVLSSFNKENIVIMVDNDQVEFNRDEIASVKLHLEF